jgi:hypothetical protein
MSNLSPLWQFGISDFSTSEPLKNGELIVANGLDFIEPGLAKVAAMSEEDFLTAAARLNAADVPVLSANWFLPSAFYNSPSVGLLILELKPSFLEAPAHVPFHPDGLKQKPTNK